MKQKKRWEFPWFPFSVLFFYFFIMVLWRFELIPSQAEIIDFLEIVVTKIGIIGMFFVAFIEGLAFVGHQFPGMSMILLSVIVTSNNFGLLAAMIATMTIALTISSLANYYAGTIFGSKKKRVGKTPKTEKTLFISAIHPAFLSLYFFHKGMRKKGLKEIVLVPLIIFPYGIAIALILSLFSNFIRYTVLNESLIFLGVFIIWFFYELGNKNKDKIRNILKRK